MDCLNSLAAGLLLPSACNAEAWKARVIARLAEFLSIRPTACLRSTSVIWVAWAALLVLSMASTQSILFLSNRAAISGSAFRPEAICSKTLSASAYFLSATSTEARVRRASAITTEPAKLVDFSAEARAALANKTASAWRPCSEIILARVFKQALVVEELTPVRLMDRNKASRPQYSASTNFFCFKKDKAILLCVPILVK